jgi:hypothetical protein
MTIRKHLCSEMLSSARTKGREKLEKDLYDMQTAPSLREAILLGIFYWEDGTEFELDEESNKYLFNEAHTALLHSQTLIGWDKFVKGYIAKEWGYIQEQYYLHSKMPKKKKHTKNNWIQCLLRSLHAYRHSIWTLRNQMVHGGNTKDQRKFNRKKLLKKVVHFYRRDRHSLPQKEQCIFHLPLHLRKKQGNQQLLLWIQRATLLFETYTDDPIRNDQQHRITEWLGAWAPGTTTTNTTITTRESLEADQGFVCHSTDRDDDLEVRTKLSQMNITNWMKSWGQDSVSEPQTSTLAHKNISHQTNIQSTRDGLPHKQLS